MNIFKRVAVITALPAVFASGLLFMDSKLNASAVAYTSGPDPVPVVSSVETPRPRMALLEDPVFIGENEQAPTEAIEGETEPDSTPDVDPWDLECLAILVYQEAGGDAVCDECRYRVADVVLNRVASPDFPDTIQDVLLQSGQYGCLSWTGIQWADRASNPGEAGAVQRAYDVAWDVLTDNRHSALYGNGYVWQAGFTQGSDNVYCCGHYFGR